MTTVMRSGTGHTVTISAQLSPVEWRASYLAECRVRLRGRKRWFPQFAPVWNRTVVIGRAHLPLDHTMRGFPVLVKLPKTRRTTEFGVFVEILGKEYVAVDTVTVVL